MARYTNTRRTYRKRRGYGTRRGGFKRYRKPDTFDYARNAWHAVKQIKRMINTEVKHHEVIESSGTNITSAGTLVNLSTITQGDSSQEREGLSIKPLNLTIRMRILKNSAAGAQSVVRVGICRGKQENGSGGSALTFDDIYPLAGILQPKGYDGRFKTKILKEKSYSMDVNSYTNGVFETWVVKLNGHINYTTASSLIETGGVYLYFMSDSTATNFPVIAYHARLTYTDN